MSGRHGDDTRPQPTVRASPAGSQPPAKRQGGRLNEALVRNDGRGRNHAHAASSAHMVSAPCDGSARRFRSRGTSSQNPSAYPYRLFVFMFCPTGAFHGIQPSRAAAYPIGWLGVKPDPPWHFQSLMEQGRLTAECPPKPAVIWQSQRPGSLSFLILRPTCQPPKRPCAPCHRPGKRYPSGC